MKLADLQVGIKLEFDILDEMGQVIKKHLVSRIEWIEEPDTAIIAAPIEKGIIYPVPQEALLDVYFLLNDCFYKFSACVTDRVKKEGMGFLKIKAANGFEKIQRRNFFRFEFSVPLRYRIINGSDIEIADDLEFTKCFTCNISGAGTSFFTQTRIDVDTSMECFIILDDNDIRFIGDVVRCERVDLNEHHRYSIGISFKEICEIDREEIIAYIFKEQRKLRKKGLI